MDTVIQAGSRAIMPSPYGLRLFLALLATLGVCSSMPANDAVSLRHLTGKKVAVTVFAQNEQAAALTKTAQSRLEELLADNDITVLDEKKTQELKDVFKSLEDPGAFVTAETFVENAEKFDIHGLLAIYISAETTPGVADYFSATAHADIRFIDNATAAVRALSTPPMGTRGFPPSDGLTRNSAAINAMQRAVDKACSLTGFRIGEWTRARSVDLTLSGPVRHDGRDVAFTKTENDKDLWNLAPLENQAWRKEEVTCTARSPGGGLAAVAGYIRDTDFRRRPDRLYGSRMHVVDTLARTSLLALECSPVEIKTREEPNTKQILAAAFVADWRYLCAATGNHVFLWNTETGNLIARLPLSAEPSGMAFKTDESGTSVFLQTRKDVLQYRIERSSR